MPQKVALGVPSCPVGLYEDWLWLDERIEGTTNEIELISKREPKLGRISKRGNKYLRTLFVQAAHRSPSTVSREVRGNGGYNLYQETVAREEP